MQTLSPSFKYTLASMKRSYKATTKEILMTTILFKKSAFKVIYYSIYITCSNNFHHLTNNTFSNKGKTLPTNFLKLFQCICEDINVSSIAFDVCFTACFLGVFSGPYFPVFTPNTGKYGPEKTPYLDTFHAGF